jgi:hypothetical protein
MSQTINDPDTIRVTTAFIDIFLSELKRRAFSQCDSKMIKWGAKKKHSKGGNNYLRPFLGDEIICHLISGKDAF